MKTMIFFRTALPLFLLLVATDAFSQEKELKKEVQVVKPYEPVISDANKINQLPQIEDSIKITPMFDYSITPKKINTDFQIEPIRAATVIGEPLEKLYKGYIRLGFGNYISPFGELYYHNLRSKETLWGVKASHSSSSGKLKLENDKKVYAGFMNNSLGVFGKKMTRLKTLSGAFDFSDYSAYMYGYDKELFNSIFSPPLVRKNMEKQVYSLLKARTSYKTNYMDSSNINYNTGLDYYFFHDKNKPSDIKHIEHGIMARGDFSGYYNKQLIGAEVHLNYFFNQTAFDTLNNIVVLISPYAKAGNEKLTVEGRLKAYIINEKEEILYHFYPEFLAEYDIINHFIIPFAGFSGDYIENNFQKTATENPFINPFLIVKGTNRKLSVFGGLKGNFSKELSYFSSVSFTKIENMYFFVNDPYNIVGSPVTNIYTWHTFQTVYDDVDILNISGEVHCKPSSRLECKLKGNYFQYTMTNEANKPWHKPTVEVLLNSRYILRNKIYIQADIISIGKRYARGYALNGETIAEELKGIVDVNLGIEYRYTKILSCFLRFNNLAAQKYYKWNNYPMQGFNFVAGITYSLLGEQPTAE